MASNYLQCYGPDYITPATVMRTCTDVVTNLCVAIDSRSGVIKHVTSYLTTKNSTMRFLLFLVHRYELTS